MAHTPGPWSAEKYEAAGRTWYEIWGGDTRPTQVLAAIETPGEVMEADAQLMAQAPALLAENAQLRELLQRLLIETDQHADGTCNALINVCQEARNILEKGDTSHDGSSFRRKGCRRDGSRPPTVRTV